MAQRTKTALIWLLLVGLVAVLLINRPGRGPDAARHVTLIFAEAEALEMIQSDEIVGWRTRGGTLQLLDYEDTLFEYRGDDVSKVTEALAAHGILPMQSASTGSPLSSLVGNPVFWVILISLLVIVLFILMLLRMKSTGNNIFELRRSRARQLADHNKVRFADIGGNVTAVEVMQDLVDFLRDPKQWMAAGARIPRGILLVGPPGTGKTLLARAVAGETNASFFYTSATEFVEMFVGVGSARVRDTFENAAKTQPAVIFIDELDAVGRARSSGMGTMHEEREQTLNQLLVLMDGLERFERVVVIAATNRPDVLDAALMRPGRFDRVVRLYPPSATATVDIIRIHTRNKSLDPSVTVEILAAHLLGMTGADVETALNEAAIRAVRRRRLSEDSSAEVAITEHDVCEAVAELKKSNRQFNRLDSVLVESVTQFAEPTGRAIARVTTVSGETVEGDVEWMNGTHIKLMTSNGEVVVSKDLAERIESVEGTEIASDGDFSSDRWTRPNLDVG